MKNKNLFYLGVIVLMSGFSNLFELHNFSYFFWIPSYRTVNAVFWWPFQTMLRTITVCKKDREVGVFWCIIMSAVGINLWYTQRRNLVQVLQFCFVSFLCLFLKKKCFQWIKRQTEKFTQKGERYYQEIPPNALLYVVLPFLCRWWWGVDKHGSVYQSLIC